MMRFSVNFELWIPTATLSNGFAMQIHCLNTIPHHNAPRGPLALPKPLLEREGESY